MIKRRTLTILLASACLTGWLAQPVSAHHLPLTTGGLWGGNGFTDRTVEVQFTSGVPYSPATIRDRIRDGANEWTRQQSTLSYVFEPLDIANFDYVSQCNPSSGSVTVHWDNLTLRGFPGATGAVWHCVWYNYQTTVASRKMVFASEANFYFGTGPVPAGTVGVACVRGDPNCKDDFWSTATHEFGHAAGFWHFESAWV